MCRDRYKPHLEHWISVGHGGAPHLRRCRCACRRSGLFLSQTGQINLFSMNTAFSAFLVAHVWGEGWGDNGTLFWQAPQPCSLLVPYRRTFQQDVPRISNRVSSMETQNLPVRSRSGAFEPVMFQQLKREQPHICSRGETLLHTIRLSPK